MDIKCVTLRQQYRILLVLICLLFLTPPVRADEPKWNISALNGVRAYHDGANCFNGVLAGLGYVDQLIHTQGVEFSYYLENFCQPTTDALSKGDVITVINRGAYIHGAIYIDPDTIFDKNSLVGLYGKSHERQDSLYGYRLKINSTHIQECRLPECEIKKYRCEISSSVRKSMQACSKQMNENGLADLRAQADRITQTSDLKFIFDTDLSLTIARLGLNIDQRSGAGNCDQYMLAAGTSTLFGLMLLNIEMPLDPASYQSLMTLRQNLRGLFIRMQKVDTSPRTEQILKEVSEFYKD